MRQRTNADEWKYILGNTFSNLGPYYSIEISVDKEE